MLSSDNTRGMYAIRTHGLTKDFSIGFWRPRPYRALDNLNLEVTAGETFGFLGPNGAGKTTTLKLLMQLIFPSSGGAEILGRPVGDLGVRRRTPTSPAGRPRISASPLVGNTSCISSFSVVVFPAPLGPRKPKTSPAATSIDRRSSAR